MAPSKPSHGHLAFHGLIFVGFLDFRAGLAFHAPIFVLFVAFWVHSLFPVAFQWFPDGFAVLWFSIGNLLFFIVFRASLAFHGPILVLF